MSQPIPAIPIDFTYQQKTGKMFQGTTLLATGHAGHDAGLNNPAAQDQHNVGPLPCGRYTIQPETSSNQLGIVAMQLVPHPDNAMRGRSGFFIHAPEFSEGCIVLDLEPRCTIAEAVRHGRNQLQVESGESS